MNCVEFKKWLRETDVHDQMITQEAESHMAVCPACQKLHSLDRVLENGFREALAEVDPPDNLNARIKQDLPVEPTRKKKSARRWRIAAPALAAAMAVLLVFIIFPNGSIRDIGHMGTLAMANHLDDQQLMSFTADEIIDVPAWFVERIGFPAAPPKLLEKGYVFKGGRQCKLGSKKAAYLYYSKNGKKCSLFVLNPDDLKFKLKRNKNYFVDVKNHDIRVWAEDGLVYAMVI